MKKIKNHLKKKNQSSPHFNEEHIDLTIVIKQQMLIAIGYPRTAMIKPTMNIANGIYNDSLIFKALFK